MSIKDIIPIEILSQLAEDIYRLFGLNGAVLDENNMIIQTSTNWANKICPIIRGSNNRVLCISAQKRLSKKARENMEPVVDECDVGFIKFVVPIFLDNEFLGTASGCGSLLEAVEPDVFYISKLINKEEKEVIEILNRANRISNNKLEEAIKYVKKTVRELQHR